ncbi:MAG: bifunctional 5,10-methylenetetrahydrofolate dehydrogenase/5,10-methenyltetrahydrofolate cyclohydrolase [Terriglobia bacterium]|nr:bifunctional 5,10-methylenetetrahydrofolate dehydrogenase/5,10-methenyltetrahydrofolate cyclohydrolase [Terriglobia bacterium]
MSTQHSAVLMYGKPVAEEIQAHLRAEVPEFIAKYKVVPSLAIVQVGYNAASERYIKKKIEACAKLGMNAQLRLFPDDIDADSLKNEVARLSTSPEFHGILVQLPLPRHIEEHESARTNKFDIFDAIGDEKDVDGVGRAAIASLYRARAEKIRFLPATALAVRRMMAHYGIKTQGKLAVVVGRNDITAKPILHMLGGRMCNAAAIWCHRYVSKADQERLIRDADILVTAVGSEHYSITKEMVKPGVAIFDVATRVDEAGKLHGDIKKDVASFAAYMTPVPGGVGPVTVAALTENVFRAAKFATGAAKPGYRF